MSMVSNDSFYIYHISWRELILAFIHHYIESESFFQKWVRIQVSLGHIVAPMAQPSSAMSHHGLRYPSFVSHCHVRPLQIKYNVK